MTPGHVHMTAAKFPDFFTLPPYVTVTLTQLISTLVCFWGTPILPPNEDIICTRPLSVMRPQIPGQGFHSPDGLKVYRNNIGTAIRAKSSRHYSVYFVEVERVTPEIGIQGRQPTCSPANSTGKVPDSASCN